MQKLHLPRLPVTWYILSVNVSTIDHSISLQVLLHAWETNNIVLLNLLGALPQGGLDARITPDSHCVSEMYMHMHHERMVSVSEEAPEIKVEVPENEWVYESNRDVISAKLKESAQAVKDAVISRVSKNIQLEKNYPHPTQLISFLIFHEGYHHGQIKSALKVYDMPISDTVAGPLTWDVWRDREPEGF